MITLKPLFGYLAERKMNMTDLARLLGVTPASIHRMHRLNCFNTTMIDRICSTLDIGIKDVMRWEPDKPREITSLEI